MACVAESRDFGNPTRPAASVGIEAENFVELPISVRHALDAGLLKGSHKDPVDRVLIAQARAERVAVVSTDKCFDDYGVSRLW